MRLALAPKAIKAEEGEIVEGISIKHYSNIKHDNDQWVVIMVRRYG